MPGYDSLVRFRCQKALIERLARLAVKERRVLSDLYRVVLEDYADAEEKRLGLAPLTAEEEAQYLRAAEEPVPYKVGKLTRKPAKQKGREKN